MIEPHQGRNRTMAKATIFQGAFLAASIAVSATAAAEPTAPKSPTNRSTQKSTLARANEDVLRQLRPSGLKKHARGFGALAVRGYEDVASKVRGMPKKR